MSSVPILSTNWLDQRGIEDKPFCDYLLRARGRSAKPLAPFAPSSWGALKESPKSSHCMAINCSRLSTKYRCPQREIRPGRGQQGRERMLIWRLGVANCQRCLRATMYSRGVQSLVNCKQATNYLGDRNCFHPRTGMERAGHTGSESGLSHPRKSGSGREGWSLAAASGSGAGGRASKLVSPCQIHIQAGRRPIHGSRVYTTAGTFSWGAGSHREQD